MRVPSFIHGLMLVAALAILALFPGRVFAYVGPGPGMEMIPYFMSLLVWAGVAMGGVLLWPVTAFINRFRKQPGNPSCPDAAAAQRSTEQHSS